MFVCESDVVILVNISRQNHLLWCSGHKPRSEINDPQSFVVDDASWVICVHCETPSVKTASYQRARLSSGRGHLLGWNKRSS